MGFPLNHPAVLAAAGNGLNPHLAGMLGRPTKAKAKPAPVVGPAKLAVSWWIAGLKLQSEANMGGTLPAKLRRKAAVKAAVGSALGLVPVFGWRFPVVVRLTRVGARLLDGDNLQFVFKVTRDVVADWLGVDDGDTARVTWRYGQRKARKGESVGVRITVRESQ